MEIKKVEKTNVFRNRGIGNLNIINDVTEYRIVVSNKGIILYLLFSTVHELIMFL